VSSSRLGITQNVHTPATVSVSVQANRRAAGAFQVRVPYHSPPVALPRA
jgi:hypothetical protein